MKKSFVLFSLVVSRVTNLTGQFVSVQKLFWQKLEFITTYL